MKVKTIKVGVKSTDEFLSEARDYMKNASKKGKSKVERGVYFESFSTMRKALTDKRLEIVRTIRHKKPSSVYALAKLLDRNVKSVSVDLKHLEAIGLVTLKTHHDKRERTEPKVDYDKIELEIAV